MRPRLLAAAFFFVPALVAWIPHGDPGIVVNIKTTFGASCNGVVDDSARFVDFNTWALANQGNQRITLVVPSGSTCCFVQNGSSVAFAKGVKKLVVLAYGATITNRCNGVTGGGWFAGGGGQKLAVPQSTARLATVAAGSTSVTAVTASDAGLWSAGEWALISGFDMMGFGFPTNPYFFEYVHLTSVNAGTGVITFDAPLKNTYRSTWPMFFAGNALGPDQGGPATLYQLDTWDIEVEYRGGHQAQYNQGGEGIQIQAFGRSVTYRDVTFDDGSCAIPSMNVDFKFINVTHTCTVEVDKIIENLTIVGGTQRGMDFQSASVNVFTMDGTTITNFIHGTPHKAIIRNSTIPDFRPGAAQNLGVSNELVCENSVILSFAQAGGTITGINSAFTMSGGVLSIAKSQGPIGWAPPGANLFWSGILTTDARAFQVTDVTEDNNFVRIHTSLAGGFPPSSYYYQGTDLRIQIHPAPKATFTNCTGTPEVVSLSQAPPNTPLFSYIKATLTGSDFSASFPWSAALYNLWGTLVNYKVTVNPASTQASALTLHGLGQFGATVMNPNDTTGVIDPTYNAKAGSATPRVMTPTTATGAQSGDSFSAPGSVWFGIGLQLNVSADIRAENPSTWPTITIEMTTDQGVVAP